MRVGICGTGKIGHTFGICLSMKGHEVYGYDKNANTASFKPRPYKEAGFSGSGDLNNVLKNPAVTVSEDEKVLKWDEFGKFGSFSMVDLETMVKNSDIIFLTVQTPHDKMYEGITPMPKERRDFDYKFLEVAMKDLAKFVDRPTPVIISSTVLPGTTRKRLIPILEKAKNDNIKICYAPVFVAMSTAARDFLNPEFVLFGVQDEGAKETAKSLFSTLHDAPFYECTVEEAELIKVSYNTFIGMKIVFANTLMEICHKTNNCNVDNVTDALKLAHRRLISPAYLSGGMGDGGGCHPRDNIAMSWLARNLFLSVDIFEDLMMARDQQAEFLCELLTDAHWNIHKENEDRDKVYDIPLLILGTSFKPESNIETGSPALLCKNHLEGMGYTVHTFDPHVDGDTWGPRKYSSSAILIGTKHKYFEKMNFPKGSIVIDPFRYIKDKKGITVIRVGE